MFLSQPLLHVVEHDIQSALGTGARVKSIVPVAGGDINQTFRIQTDQQAFFLKANSKPNAIQMFMAESTGLALLGKAAKASTPTTYTMGQAHGEAFLLMEWIEPGPASKASSEALGTLLAGIHRATQDQFGLDHDNFIGSLPQRNKAHDTWADFFIQERLETQIREAHDRGLFDSKLSKAFQNLYARLPEIFPDEPPALLHGDLWSGNYLVGTDSRPVLVDPAAYYGHREIDIAMTRLFGGFDLYFYNAYHHVYPLSEGWEDRIDILNLYPLLVHLNLFGKSYLGRIETIVRQFGS